MSMVEFTPESKARMSAVAAEIRELLDQLEREFKVEVRSVGLQRSYTPPHNRLVRVELQIGEPNLGGAHRRSC